MSESLEALTFSGIGNWDSIWTSVFFVLAIWTLYWKYRALWLAAKKDSRRWFIILLIINTIGILEILYVYVFSKKPDLSKHNEDSVPLIP